eukprot:2323372-Pleurochrysis_carterae.AAC.1
MGASASSACADGCDSCVLGCVLDCVLSCVLRSVLSCAASGRARRCASVGASPALALAPHAWSSASLGMPKWRATLRAATGRETRTDAVKRRSPRSFASRREVR